VAIPDLLLAGDIGGTKTNLGLFEAGPPLVLARGATYPSRQQSGLGEMVVAFLGKDRGHVAAAAFGVAGPVRNNAAVLPNLPWSVDGGEVARAIGIPSVTILNDVAATAWAVDQLGEKELATLQRGQRSEHGARAVIAAGTGLGEAVFISGRWSAALPSEGGHADFAPRTDLEIALLVHLRAQFGRVSWERVVSGRGLVNVFRFLVETGRAHEPAGVAERLGAGDPAAAISRAALAGESPACEAAMDVFASAYGAEAGNLALRAVATGGVYLGGGIAPKILPWLERGGFLGAFRAKGRLSPFLMDVPVHVILNDRAALLGAAACAAAGREPVP
jgi:glucokinase